MGGAVFMECPELEWYRVNVPRLSILLGLLEIVVGFFPSLPRTRGLYTGIALGPIVAGLIAYARYQGVKGDKGTAKVVVETAWIPLSFGCAYFVMAPSRYYAAGAGAMAAALIVATAMILLGVRTMIAFGRRGFQLTP